MNYPIPQPVGYTTETKENTLAIRGTLTREPVFVGHTGHYGAIREWLQTKSEQGLNEVVLDIDCCGGDVSGLSALAHEIRNSSLKIKAHVTGLAASAAYCLAAACSFIEAEEDAIIGAIGSYVETPKKPETVVVSERTPLKLEGGEHLQILANDSGDRFLSDVAEFRGFDSNDLDKVAEICGFGKLMTAKEALQRNLIDFIAQDGVPEMPIPEEIKKEEVVEEKKPEPGNDGVKELLDKVIERLMPAVSEMIEKKISEMTGGQAKEEVKEEEVKEEEVKEEAKCGDSSMIDRAARADLKRLEFALLRKDGVWQNEEDENVASQIYDLDRGLFKKIYEKDTKNLLNRFSSASAPVPKIEKQEILIQKIDAYLEKHQGVGYAAAKEAVLRGEE